MPRTPTKRAPRRPLSDEAKAQIAARKEEVNARLAAYALELIGDPEAVEQFRATCASIDAGNHPGAAYTLRNGMVIAAYSPNVTHLGGFDYWLGQGRAPMKGTKKLPLFVRMDGRRKKDEGEPKASKESPAEETKAKEAKDGEQKAEKRRPKYKLAGTFDVSQTRPIETCLHCGTTPTGPEDRTTQCLPTCHVLRRRSGILPDLDDVLDLAATLIDAEAGEEELDH